MSFKIVPSKTRGGQNLITEDGFRYKKDRKTRCGIHYRCVVSSCYTRLMIDLQSSYIIRSPGPHIHKPDYIYNDHERFRQEMLVKVKKYPTKKLRTLYDEQIKSYSELGDFIAPEYQKISSGLLKHQKQRNQNPRKILPKNSNNHQDIEVMPSIPSNPQAFEITPSVQSNPLDFEIMPRISPHSRDVKFLPGFENNNSEDQDIKIEHPWSPRENSTGDFLLHQLKEWVTCLFTWQSAQLFFFLRDA